jgi:hypothetical protein
LKSITKLFRGVRVYRSYPGECESFYYNAGFERTKSMLTPSYPAKINM